jgi:hypothetical protein
MTQQLELSIIGEINAAYLAAINAAQSVRKTAGEAVQHAYRCGVMLNKAKEAAGKARFPQWLREHCPKLESRFTDNWMRLAAAVDRGDIQLDGHSSMKRLLEALEVIEHPERETQQAAHCKDPDTEIVKQITNTMTAIGKLRESEPVDKWSAMRRMTIKAQLEPLMELFKAL